MEILTIKEFKKNKLTYFQSFVAFILLLFTFIFNEKEFYITFSTVIGLILYYMIFLELIRTTMDFIFDNEHKFKVRYIYDMGIMFIIREILVTMAAKHHTIIEEIPFLLISAVFLLILFHLRIKDAQIFKYTDKCDGCVYTYNNKEL